MQAFTLVRKKKFMRFTYFLKISQLNVNLHNYYSELINLNLTWVIFRQKYVNFTYFFNYTATAVNTILSQTCRL